MTRPILYIAGPYSAGHGRSVTDNIAVARRYAVAAAKAGWMPFTPHLNTAGFEIDCPEIPHSAWLDGDLAILDLLDPAVDAVLMLPGWDKSRGATVERQRALVRGLEIFDPPAHSGCIPPAGGRGLCPHYRQVHYETDSRDTCGSPGMQCPDEKTCPIRRRCR
ncbi:MAG: DUF1937 family protein [Bacilli bacterium]